MLGVFSSWRTGTLSSLGCHHRNSLFHVCLDPRVVSRQHGGCGVRLSWCGERGWSCSLGAGRELGRGGDLVGQRLGCFWLDFQMRGPRSWK